LNDHATVWRLMPQVQSVLGVSLTESFQLVPEQSTAAIVVHHPDAKYYSVGNLDRTAQILGK
jgi:5-methyltetrahydrofolate--homocysteine methyltransferase